MADPVLVVDYDPEWPTRFEWLRRRLLGSLSDLPVSIEHIGSTAVPGLASKPVIDIDVVVQSSDDVPVAIERLRSLGYQHQGGQGVHGREAFSWPSGEVRHHLYVVVRGGGAYLRHLLIRDYLRAHPDEASAYGELKKALAEKYREDRAGYTEGKDVFTDRIFLAAQEVGATHMTAGSPRLETTWDGVPVAPERPYASCVVVWRQGQREREFLVLHRLAPGGLGYEGDWAWTPPAGARQPGETPEQAAARELHEETGLSLSFISGPIAAHSEDVALYIAEAPSDVAVVLDEEHDSFEWLPVGEAAMRCLPAEVGASIVIVANELDMQLRPPNQL